jgi:hypothetical protein
MRVPSPKAGRGTAVAAAQGGVQAVEAATAAGDKKYFPRIDTNHVQRLLRVIRGLVPLFQTLEKRRRKVPVLGNCIQGMHWDNGRPYEQKTF